MDDEHEDKEARLRKYNAANQFRGLLEQLVNGIENDDSGVLPFGDVGGLTLEDLHELLTDKMEENKE